MREKFEQITSLARQVMRLNNTSDPAMSQDTSDILSRCRSILEVEARIIHQTLAEELHAADHLLVMSAVPIDLPSDSLDEQEALRTGYAALPYTSGRHRRQIDLIVFNHVTRVLTLLEVKRGGGSIGSSRARDRQRDNVALERIGVDFARQAMGVQADVALARVLSYYGRTGLAKDITVMGADLDQEFRVPVVNTIEKHLSYFRLLLDCQRPGLTDALVRAIPLSARDLINAQSPGNVREQKGFIPKTCQQSCAIAASTQA